MRVQIQTRFTPPVTVYDTEARALPSERDNLIKSLLKPVVQVTASNGGMLYKSGDFYPATGFYITMLILGLSAGYLVYRAVK